METIEINSSNFKEFQNLNAIAFSFAHPGAQGEDGSIKIMTSKGVLYHTNIIHSIKLEEVFTVCPALKECQFNLFTAIAPKGWISFYMGGGNFLIVKDEYKEVITKAIPNGLYNCWEKYCIM